MTAPREQPIELPAAGEGASQPATGSSPLPVPYTLHHLALYALRLGTFGFGGPVALVGYMRRDLVERRRWITEAEYAEGLALAQLAPGPLAAQLARMCNQCYNLHTSFLVVQCAFARMGSAGDAY